MTKRIIIISHDQGGACRDLRSADGPAGGSTVCLAVNIPVVFAEAPTVPIHIRRRDRAASLIDSSDIYRNRD
jgi:hypothetical protein